MRVVLATSNLGLGGSESYLLTVAEQFDRLGHEAVVYAADGGEGVEGALERGVEVVAGGDLPTECDAVLVQDAAVTLELAERYPGAPRLFVAHSESFDLQAPPQLAGAVSAVIALNDRVAARMRAFAVEVEVVRLRQPIDTERFVSRVPLPPVPRRALLLSNTPVADRLRPLEDACAEAGLELSRLGGIAGRVSDPRGAIADAEIVIGYGRSILEAMACGRAAYVYDWNGGDGWITAESYPAIEADGIAGRGGRQVLDRGRLAADLKRYDPSMGPVNHDLVIGHHRANVHAQELIALARGLAPIAEPPRDALREMARLVRMEWRARTEVHALSAENVRLRDAIEETGARQERLREEAEAQLRESYESSLSWRVTAPLRRLSGGRRRRSSG